MTIDHHVLLSLVISMPNAQNEIHLLRIMQLEKLNKRIQQLQVTVDKPTHCINLIYLV